MPPFLLELLGDLHWTFVSVGIVSSVLFTGLVLRTRRRARAPVPAVLPPLTVLKPFDGVDPGMEDSFWTYLATPYAGDREVLFCTAAENAEGRAIVERLIARLARDPQPGVSARLLVPDPDERPWITRKVWHMARGYAAASHDLIASGDSGTRLRPGVLEALVAALLASDERGAAWAPYSVGEATTFGGRMTRVAWTGTTMNFLVIEALHRAFGQRPLLAGGLFVARRDAIEQIDGFAAADGFLTEDYEVGRRIDANGWEVVPSPVPVERHLGPMPFAEFFGRQQRWNTIVWKLKDPLRIPYPLTMCGLAIAPVTCVLASLAFPARIPEYAIALGALYAVRGLYGLLLNGLTAGRIRLETLLLLPLVDAVFLLTWARGPFIRTVQWRDVLLRVESGGRVTPVPPQGTWRSADKEETEG